MTTPTTIRMLEKEVTVTSQAQYQLDGALLKLRRFRINAEGKVGSWQVPSAEGGNGGWPNLLTKDLKEPKVPATKGRRK